MPLELTMSQSGIGLQEIAQPDHADTEKAEQEMNKCGVDMSLSLPEEEGTILMGMTGESDSGMIKQIRKKEVREASFICKYFQ